MYRMVWRDNVMSYDSMKTSHNVACDIWADPMRHVEMSYDITCDIHRNRMRHQRKSDDITYDIYMASQKPMRCLQKSYDITCDISCCLTNLCDVVKSHMTSHMTLSSQCPSRMSHFKTKAPKVISKMVHIHISPAFVFSQGGGS